MCQVANMDASCIMQWKIYKTLLISILGQSLDSSVTGVHLIGFPMWFAMFTIYAWGHRYDNWCDETWSSTSSEKRSLTSE